MNEFWKSWKFWLIVTAVVLVVVGIILYFTVPAFKSMVLEIAASVLIFVVGAIVGHFIK